MAEDEERTDAEKLVAVVEQRDAFKEAILALADALIGKGVKSTRFTDALFLVSDRIEDEGRPVGGGTLAALAHDIASKNLHRSDAAYESDGADHPEPGTSSSGSRRRSPP